jgi:hypothetical protein
MADNQLFDRVAGLTVAARKLGAGLRRLGDPGLFVARVRALEEEKLSFREAKTNNASNAYPFTYVAPIALAAATTRIQANITISQFGWFFADRIWASWLPAAGAVGANAWGPIGRSNPFIAGAGHIVAGVVANTLNFFLEYSDVRTQQSRQNLPIPGDLLYRTDGDGYLLPGGDAFGPNASISLLITPTVAPANAGVLYVCFNGVQLQDVLPQ